MPELSPLIISLQTTVVATVITFALGLFAAHRVARMRRFKGFVDGLFTLPMVLPPTVVGFFLLLMLGKNSPFGKLLQLFDTSVVFTWGSTVIAAVVVSFPLMYRTVRGAFEQLDPNLVYAARTLRMSETRIFWQIIVPNSWSGIAAGTVLSFSRALGEFGATIMIAGNVPGRTQTMSTAIYTAVQSGNRAAAYRWVAIIMAISLISMLMMNRWVGKAAKGAQRMVES